MILHIHLGKNSIVECVPQQVSSTDVSSEDVYAELVEKVDMIQKSTATANIEDTRTEDSESPLKAVTSSSSESNIIPCGAESKMELGS